jgi:delta8-fatty-acid desaturase
MDRDAIIAPRMVEALIADGQTIVIFEDYVLRLDSWLEKHPGGRLAILHMIGRDATDEIKVYHTAKTCKTMRAFRIGRKQGVWVNMTPPIRGGVFRPYDPISVVESSEDSASSASDSEGTDEDRLDDDALSHTSSECSCEHGVEQKTESEAAKASGTALSPRDATSILRQRATVSRHTAKCPLHDEDAAVAAATTASAKGSATVMRFADAGVLQEVVRDSANYPSVEPLVQQEITNKYRALHQRIRDEGLYECRYIEYGKEMARYSALFAAFLTALYFKQYMISAVFLGLFWVCWLH